MKPSENIITYAVTRTIQTMCVITAFFALFMALPEGNPAEVEAGVYCEMVELFQDTNGEFGWPDYKGIYNNTCGVRA